METYLDNMQLKYLEMIDTFPLTDEIKEKNKEAIRVNFLRVLEYYEKGDTETTKKAIHHLNMEITKLVSEINSSLCNVNPNVGRNLVADLLQHLEERKVKAKYVDNDLGEFTEMEQMLKDRTMVLLAGFKRRNALGCQDIPNDMDATKINEAVKILVKDNEIINSSFVSHLTTAFSSGRSAQIIQITQKKFTAFFNIFYPLWNTGIISKKFDKSEYDFIGKNFQMNNKDISKSTISGAKNRGNWV